MEGSKEKRQVVRRENLMLRVTDKDETRKD
ncbi:hypothetical protein HmCmsJML020_02367 [Escherichia coli]|nr:hypothetical protein HmCmsJML020_02367 [Escherichia coli]